MSTHNELNLATQCEFPLDNGSKRFFFFGCFFFLNCNNGLHESLILERCVATKTIFKETTLSTIQ